ncbi:Crp/Fnr family transcriptional regulator [Mucilaginibacter pocheonensis]|uniref:CRP/FNR family transcriptional regulator n=1 Tax=Mucilaginibacter pocheonensis TaxID=398050 RepID=A0ABU1TIH9_9SPHI|nr:Crp/Fnr family transcriptional regulator [Mucilaginibacter pocheonensis]MDR6945134.1 CRP/FNR family transcriptional regulator [Mucilaginibacter pocheonensis]
MKKSQNICDNKSCFLCKNSLKEWLPAIAAHKTNFKVKKGEVIFKEGDPVTGIYFVNSGKVKVYKKWDKDKELIVRFAKEGSLFGHRGLGKGGNYPISASALEPTVVCYVDIAFFEASLKVNPDFTYELLMFLTEELKQSERKMRNLAHMPVKGRVAEALISLQNQFGTTADGFINIDLSRQDLASYAGATYETVFRMMNELVSEKLISLSGKSIRLVNRDELLKLAQDVVFL